MQIIELKDRPDITGNDKGSKAYLQLAALLSEIRKRELPDAVAGLINNDVVALNAIPDGGNELLKAIRQRQGNMIKNLEKHVKVVTKNYYRNIWLPVGMTAFGLPIGVTIGVSLGKMGLLGVGLPIGMFIGILVGVSLDKKALKEGRQMDIDIKYY
ncbi:hypothetical protein DBR32_08570 [Taibaiella sp. KBW10]|uniref:hypothetical protein n=1 Tax=Taibaiella sp. KBW10 TaxID=2153357 RepID=UPI000F59738D|nr:hypothetical protein [Taibaiella sp. KBW10]RQO31168.1 hypothetical protein DBR32_08570 [Taibaiella sp. KBW10]